MAAFFAILIGFGVDRYLFLINREGFSKWAQAFILVLLISHNFITDLLKQFYRCLLFRSRVTKRIRNSKQKSY